MSVAGLLLAAGGGRRMGKPKALLVDERGQTWVERSARVLTEAALRPVLVAVGAEAAAVRRHLPAGCQPVMIEAWADGMGASLSGGLTVLLREFAEAVAVVITLVDTPGVGVASVRRLAALASRDVLARATYDGVPGHPVLIGRAHWEGVRATAEGDRGARAYLRTHIDDVLAVDCTDLGSGADVDTPDEL